MTLNRNRPLDTPRLPSWSLKGLLWCGLLLWHLAPGVEMARATSVTMNGSITDTSTGNTGTVNQSYNATFTPVATTPTSDTLTVAVPAPPRAHRPC